MIRRLAVALLVSLVAANVARADWTMFQGNGQHTGQATVVGPSSKALEWNIDLGISISPLGGPSVGQYDVFPLQDRIVIGADDGVHVFYEDGTLFRFWPTPAPVETVVTIANNRLYFGAGDSLYCYSTLGQVWSKAMDSDGITHVTTHNDTIYVCDKARLWSLGIDGSVNWMSANLAGVIRQAAPVVDSAGNVYVATDYGTFSVEYRLYAFHGDGSLWWTYDHVGLGFSGAESTPTIDELGNVYVTSVWKSFNSFHGISSSKDGFFNWERDDQTLYASSAYDNGSLYYGNNYGLRARTSSNGLSLWVYNTPSAISYSSPLIDVAGNIFVGDDGGRFMAINSSGGAIWSQDSLGGAVGSPAIGDDGTIYVTAGSSIYAFGAVATGIVETTPNFYELSVHPNPFQLTSVVSYSLPGTDPVDVSIYDVKGRLVRHLVRGQRASGLQTTSLPQLASGVYFVKVSSVHHVQTTKVVVIK